MHHCPPERTLHLSQPKQKPEPEERIDTSTEREEGLSRNFQDPGLDEILAPAAPSLIEEAAEAVHELVLEAAGANEELVLVAAHDVKAHPGEAEGVLEISEQAGTMSIEPGLDLAGAANLVHAEGQSLGMEEVAKESSGLFSRVQMSEGLFGLVVSDRSFNDLVEGALAALVKAVGAEAGSVLELDNEKGEFFFRATLGGGDPAKVKAFRIPLNQGIVGHVAESRQALLLGNLETDEKELHAVSMSTGFETKSCLAAPVVIGNQLYGVVELFNKLSGERFNEADLEIFEAGVLMLAKVLEVRFLTAELARRAG